MLDQKAKAPPLSLLLYAHGIDDTCCCIPSSRPRTMKGHTRADWKGARRMMGAKSFPTASVCLLSRRRYDYAHWPANRSPPPHSDKPSVGARKGVGIGSLQLRIPEKALKQCLPSPTLHWPKRSYAHARGWSLSQGLRNAST